jgi:hypothetical protein
MDFELLSYVLKKWPKLTKIASVKKTKTMNTQTKNIYPMKPIVYSAMFVFTVFLSACSTSNSAKKNTDDVYYNPKEVSQEVYKEKSSPSSATTGSQNSSENSTQQNSKNNSGAANNNSGQRSSDNNSNFDTDDYYDYSYSSRLRRFHSPNAIVVGGYYDPWYTNMYYYDCNPYNFGTSIYTTYSFFSPGYTTIMYSRPFGWGCSFGYGTRWGWNPYGGWNNGWYGYDPFYAWNNPWMWNSPYYNGWNNPYAWNNGWGCGGYYNGFNQGFAQGYWNGYNQGLMGSNYFNSYDRNSYYYGRRNNVSTSGRFDNSGGRVGQGIGDTYINAMANERDNVKNISTINPIMKEYISAKNDALKPTNIDRANTIKNSNGLETKDLKPIENKNFDAKNPATKGSENVKNSSNNNFDYRANQPATNPNNDVKNSNFDTKSPSDNKPSWDAKSPSKNNSFDTRVPENKNFENNNEIRRNKEYNNSGNSQSNDRNFSSPPRGRDERSNNSFDTKPSRDNYFNDFKQGGRNNSTEPSSRPRMESPRQSAPRMESPRQSAPRMESPRQSAPSQRGGGRR